MEISKALNNEPDTFIPTRRTLLSRLKDWDDQESWKAFFETYWKMIYKVALRAGLNETDAQEVVQETIIAVAKQIPKFKYDRALGTFKAWLMQITHCRIADQFRKKQYQRDGKKYAKETHLSTSLLEQQADPSAFRLESVWNEEWNKHLLELAIENVKKKVSPKHYQMFYLHVCKELPAKTVAAKLDMKLAEVYFAKYKVGLLIKKEIRRLEKQIL